jgi:H+/gluconate symporter-like permease
VIGVTCGQWVMELALTILVSIIHTIKGKNRAIEHAMTLFVAGFSYVILPAFYLMADQQFRNNLEKSGLYKAIINAFKQNSDTNVIQAIVTPSFNFSKHLIHPITVINQEQQN